VKTVQLLEQQEWVSSGADNLCDNILQNPLYRTFYQQLKAPGVWVI